nr:MAG TPA: hypothetical protein [Herelleviridae sp.]
MLLFDVANVIVYSYMSKYILTFFFKIFLV